MTEKFSANRARDVLGLPKRFLSSGRFQKFTPQHLRVFIFWHLCWSRDVAVILTRALLVKIEGGRWVPSYPFSLMPDSNP